MKRLGRTGDVAFLVWMVCAAHGLGQSFFYDGEGRLTEVRYDASHAIRYAYDLQDNLTNVTVTASQAEADTDADGLPDAWELVYFNTLTNTAAGDPTHDGLSNLQKYLLGLNPLVPARPYLQPLLSATNGHFALNVQGLFGRSVTLQISTNLTSWQALTNLTSTNAVIYFEDRKATNSGSRFYRAVVP
jgi:YD repeat-containing protein